MIKIKIKLEEASKYILLLHAQKRDRPSDNTLLVLCSLLLL